jgi:hypothetical protein
MSEDILVLIPLMVLAVLYLIEIYRNSKREIEKICDEKINRT